MKLLVSKLIKIKGNLKSSCFSLKIVLFALVGTGFARPGYDGGLNNIESRFGGSVPQSGQRGYGGGPSRQVSLVGYDGPVPQSGQEGYGGEFGLAKHDFYHHVHDKHCDHHNHGHY